MPKQVTLSEAVELAETLGRRLHGLRLPNDARSRVAFACFAIAQQHHSAILVLLQRRPSLEATAFALLRPLLEATLRGEWILHCASDEQVKTFALGGKKQLDMSSIMKSLEAINPGSNAHHVLYGNMWKDMSAYTHTYEHQVRHWLGNDVAPNYSDEQVSWLLNASCGCLALLTASVRSLAVADGD